MGNKSKGTSGSLPEGIQSCLVVEDKASHAPRCGLYILNRDILDQLPEADIALPLYHIAYKIEVVNNLAKISLSQTYKNLSDVYLQAEYSFPIDPKAVIHGFRAKFGDVVISGVVKEKNEAKVEYTEAVRRGQQAAYAEIDQKSIDIMNLKVGNIPPKTEVVVQFELVQELQVQMNTFYKLRVLSNITPRYINDPVDQNKSWFNKIKAFASTLSLQKPAYTWGFDVNLKSSTQITFCNSSSHSLLQTKINQNKTETDFMLDGVFVPNKDFVFVYSNELMMTSTLGITDVGVSAALSFIPKFSQVKLDDAFLMMQKSLHPQVDMENTQGEYIFILDRSGSMSGSRISKALEAMKFFLKSLPPKTIFNIVSFGTKFSLMFPSSVEYNDHNLNMALSKLSQFGADMGGTEIQGALKEIYGQKIRPYYPRQLFLLTDGDVSDTNRVISLVARNVKFSRCHTIGIGNGCSHALIKGCAEKGKGKAIFIDDGADVASPIIQLLQQSLTPVVSQFSLDYDSSVVDIIVPNPKNMPFILKNQPVNFYVIFKEGFKGSVNFKLRYTQTVHNIPYQNTIVVNTEDNEMNFPFVDKIAYHKIISVLMDKHNNKTNLSDHMVFAKDNDNIEKEIISYSIKHQVLCPLTAFICVGRKLVDGEFVEFQEKGSKTVVVPQYASEEETDLYKFPGGAIGGRGGAIRTKAARCFRSSTQDQSSDEEFKLPKTPTISMCLAPEMSVSKSKPMAKKKKEKSEERSKNQAATISRPAAMMPMKQQNNVDLFCSVEQDLACDDICYNQVVDLEMMAQSSFDFPKTDLQMNQPMQQMQQMQPQPMSPMSPMPPMPPMSMCLPPKMPLPQSKPMPEKEMKKNDGKSSNFGQLFGQSSKPQSKNSLDKKQSPQALVAILVNAQKTDGSWEPTHQLIAKLFPNQTLLTTFDTLSKQFEAFFVLTCVIAAWLQKHYNTPSYSLIIKKAQSWLNKRQTQYQLQNLTPITQTLHISVSL